MRGKKRFRGYMGITLVIEVAARSQNAAFKKAQKAMTKLNESVSIEVNGKTEDGKPTTNVVGKMHPGSAYTNSIHEVRRPRRRRTDAEA